MEMMKKMTKDKKTIIATVKAYRDFFSKAAVVGPIRTTRLIMHLFWIPKDLDLFHINLLIDFPG